MKTAWKQFLSPIPGSVRTLLLLLVVCYVAAVVGAQTRTFNLYEWLALSPPEFWHGRVWQAATYWLLPAGLADFLINGLMAAWLLTRLAMVWSNREIWIYWMVCAVGMALVQAAVLPHDEFLTVGISGIFMGLLVAFARNFGHEQWSMMGVWPMSGRTAALLMAAISVVATLPCAGLVRTLIMLSGGVIGWGYLALRSKMNLARRSQVVPNERMSRLEL